MRRRFCFALDLKDDPALIAKYRKYHEKIWPEITQGLKDSGIEDLEIHLLGTYVPSAAIFRQALLLATPPGIST